MKNKSTLAPEIEPKVHLDNKIEFHFFQLIADDERLRIAQQVVPFVQGNFNPMPRSERRTGKSFYIEIEPYFLRIRCKINRPIEVIEMKEAEFLKEVDKLSGRWN